MEETIKPYYKDDYVEIYCGDCLEILPQLINKLKNGIIITDPPFNVGKEFRNDNLTNKDFMAFCNKFVLTLYELKPENILIEINKNDKIIEHEFERYFNFEYRICLNYTNSMRNGKIGYANWGLIDWFTYNGGKCYKPYKDRLDSDLENTLKKFKHPSPKSIKHYKRLIDMFSNDSHIIIDPFMGSGTTIVSAKELNRKAVGIEIEKKYCDLTINRLKQKVFNFD